MAKGGKQPGAGRPKGSKNKFSIHEHFKAGDVETFIEFLKANYMEDSKLMVWLGDQLFGKAAQSIDHTTKGEKMVVPLLDRGLSTNDSTGENKSTQ